MAWKQQFVPTSPSHPSGHHGFTFWPPFFGRYFSPKMGSQETWGKSHFKVKSMNFKAKLWTTGVMLRYVMLCYVGGWFETQIAYQFVFTYGEELPYSWQADRREFLQIFVELHQIRSYRFEWAEKNLRISQPCVESATELMHVAAPVKKKMSAWMKGWQGRYHMMISCDPFFKYAGA